MTRHRSEAVRFGAMGALYVVFGLVGRASVIDGGTVALVWPAAGVGFLWLLYQPDVLRFWGCLVAEALLLAVVMGGTGASPALVATAVAASAVQTAACVLLLRRWCPNLLGTGGTGSAHSIDVVSRGTAAVLVGTTLGALVGGAGLAMESGTPHALDFISWWVRNFTGVIVVGAIGHLSWEWSRGSVVRTVPRRRLVELAVLLGLSVAAYLVVFIQPGLPLAFATIPLTVWVSLRFPTVVAAAHTGVFGAVTTALTLTGRGPFGDIAQPAVEAIVTQSFLLTAMLTALAIAAGRDERAVLAAGLVASERAANERAELLDAMTEAMTEGLAVVDTDGAVVRMNAACRELLALTPQGLRANSRDYELKGPGGVPLDPSQFPSARALREGTVAAHDLHLAFADGSTRVLSVNAAALTGGTMSGEHTGALVVYRDVTAERQDRSELAAFASTVAHDLRSPLMAIRGWLDLLSAQVDDLVDGQAPRSQDGADARESVSRATSATSRMASLIQELLAQATAEGRPLDMEVVKLSGDEGLVLDVTELLPGEVDVVIGDIPDVLADEDLVYQLLGNLIGNSVKYADPGRPTRITITGMLIDGRVQIDISDNGVGVPAEHRDRVFDKFHRAHAADKRFVGTGLGLSLCRTIVERHGGGIACLPGQGGFGTTMRFDLPSPKKEATGVPAVA